MNLAMSSSRKVRVSFDWLPIESDHVPDAAAGVTRPWTMNPSGASISSTSFMARWSRNAPIERKTSSKSWRGLPS